MSNLNPVQFPTEQVLRMESPEFDSTVGGAVNQMREYYGRTDLGSDPGDQAREQQRLVDSVKQHGIRKPVQIAAPIPGEGGEHLLLNGHHRVAAAVAAGLRSIPAVVHQPVLDAEGTMYPTYYDRPDFLNL